MTMADEHSNQAQTIAPTVPESVVPAGSPVSAATTPPKRIVTHAHSLEFVKFIREEIRFQHGLLGVRISWLLAAEAFFFTAFAISRGSQLCNELIFFWKYTVPIAAGSIAFLALPAIWAAIDRIGEQRRLLHNYELADILPLGNRWDAIMHFVSLAFAILVPVLFIVAWVFVGCLALPSQLTPKP
jgi:hypothetical protein